MISCMFCDKVYKLCHNSKSACFLAKCAYKDHQEAECSCLILRPEIISKRQQKLKKKQVQIQKSNWTGKYHFVHVVSGRAKCIDLYHKWVEYQADVYNTNSKSNTSLKVFFCTTCQKWYISESLVRSHHMVYGIQQYVHFSSHDYHKNNKYDTWDTQSILVKNGYTAQEGKLTAFQRQHILKDIIDKEILSPYQIINHLNGLIELHQFNEKWENAISKYESDIQYINKLKTAPKTNTKLFF